jgi:hypothetical protein
MTTGGVGTLRATLCAAVVSTWGALCLITMGLPGSGVAAASLALWGWCAFWVAGETPARARRRLLLVAAALSFAAALGLAWHLLAPPLLSSRAGSENALGLPFLELIGRFLLVVILPTALAAFGLLLLLLAWLTGREPRLRRVQPSEMSRPGEG